MIIPRHVLFSSSLGNDAQISDDGEQLLFARRNDQGHHEICVKSLTSGKISLRATSPNVRSLLWAANESDVLYLEDASGDENFRCVIVGIDGQARYLTPPGHQARILATSSLRPDEIIVEINLTDPRRHDVYRWNLTSGEHECVATNPGNIVGWVADDQLEVRAALSALGGGGFQLCVRKTALEKWTEVLSWGADEHGHPLFFSADGATLYLIGNHGAETNRLIGLDLESGVETLVAFDPEYDLAGALRDPVTGGPQAVAVSADRSRMLALDRSIEPDLDAIRREVGESFRVFNRSRDTKTWLLSGLSDRRPPACYIYQRDTSRTSLAIDDNPEFDGLEFSQMEPISFRARDKLLLHGYLTRPVGADCPGPAILKVHGGPWARDTWGFDPTVQWLANRGYCVLQLNYRGSAGYGKHFLAAGFHEWGRKMHDDLIDGADWLVAQSFADPAKVGIMGASYGGYATLAALSLSPERFAAGVSMFAPTDLLAFLRNVPRQWTSYRALLHARVGDPDIDADSLEGVSPITNFESIRAPLLAAHGANDARVPCAESDRFVSALRSIGGDVEYYVFEREGHGLTRPENRLYLCAKIESFFSRYLGGQCEPEYNISGHSALVK